MSHHHCRHERSAASFCLAGDGEGSLTVRHADVGGDGDPAATGEQTLLADRLAWSMVARTHPWDCITRLRRLYLSPYAATTAADVSRGGEGDEGDGGAALRRALVRADDMLHAQGHHSRPHYAALLAARKVRCWQTPDCCWDFDIRGGLSCCVGQGIARSEPEASCHVL